MARMKSLSPAVEVNAREYDPAANYKRWIFPVSRVTGHLLMAIGTAVVLLAAITFLSLIVPKIAGCNAYIVASGSMEPEYPVNCIVYVKPADPSGLCEGDVITFENPSRGTIPITHRIVENDPEKGTLMTKGDANAFVDQYCVPYDNVIGKVVMHVPYLGIAAFAFSSTAGRLAAALVLLASWALIEMGRYFRKASLNFIR